MKVVLLLSLIANCALGYLYWKESTKPPLERTIVETHEKKVFVRVPTRSETQKARKLDPTQPEASAAMGAPQMLEFDPKAYEMGVEKVSHDRESFMQEKLELTPEDLAKIEKIKTDFYKEADKLILGHSEPTVEQRRQLLDLEESREKEFSKLMGQEKWQRFKKYRDDYNRRQYERQTDEQSVFIPMDI